MDRTEAFRALVALHVAGARLGRTRDFTALVDLAGPRLLAHARRLTDDAETARDVVQEAWLAISRGLHGLRDERAFLPWALRIVSRRAARDVRGRTVRRVGARAFAAEAEVTTGPSTGAGHDATVLRRALGELPAGQRAALALYYLEEMSVAEVAVALDLPEGTVKTRLMHARNKLRTLLKGDDDGQA